MSETEIPSMLLSVVIPCYNERETIRKIVQQVQKVPIKIELIVVDDGSTDGSREILAGLNGDGIQIIHHPENRGKGAALSTGFAAARGDVIVIQVSAEFSFKQSRVSFLPCPTARWKAAEHAHSIIQDN